MSFKTAVCPSHEEKVAVARVGDHDSNLAKLVAYIQSLAKDSSLKVGSLRSLRKQGYYMMGMHHRFTVAQIKRSRTINGKIKNVP